MDESWVAVNPKAEDEEEKPELVTLPRDDSPVQHSPIALTAPPSYAEGITPRTADDRPTRSPFIRVPEHYNVRSPPHEVHTYGDQQSTTHGISYGSDQSIHGRLGMMQPASFLPQYFPEGTPMYGRQPMQPGSPWPHPVYHQQSTVQQMHLVGGASTSFTSPHEAQYHRVQQAMPTRPVDMRFGRINNAEDATYGPFAAPPSSHQMYSFGPAMRSNSVDSILGPRHGNALHAVYERSPSIVLPSNTRSLSSSQSSKISPRTGNPKKTYLAGKTPGPGKAGPVAKCVDSDGKISIQFSYNEKGVPRPWFLRCDIDDVEDCELPHEFKEANATYLKSYEVLQGVREPFPRCTHDMICNNIGWRLVFKNPQLYGKKGVIQRAVNSFRNVPIWTRFDKPDTRSRRTKRVHRDAAKEQKKADQARMNEVVEQQPLPSFEGSVYDFPGAPSQLSSSDEGEPGLLQPQSGPTRTSSYRPHLRRQMAPSPTPGLQSAGSDSMSPFSIPNTMPPTPQSDSFELQQSCMGPSYGDDEWMVDRSVRPDFGGIGQSWGHWSNEAAHDNDWDVI